MPLSSEAPRRMVIQLSPALLFITTVYLSLTAGQVSNLYSTGQQKEIMADKFVIIIVILIIL